MRRRRVLKLGLIVAADWQAFATAADKAFDWIEAMVPPAPTPEVRIRPRLSREMAAFLGEPRPLPFYFRRDPLLRPAPPNAPGACRIERWSGVKIAELHTLSEAEAAAAKRAFAASSTRLRVGQ